MVMKDQPQALAQGSGELYKEYVEYESEEDKNGATDQMKIVQLVKY